MAVQGFYTLTEKIKSILEDQEWVNTVSYGDLFEVATEKHNIYPISHFMVNNISVEENLYRFNISLLCMDLIDQVKDTQEDYFAGNDNIHDIFNTQLMVATKLIEELRDNTEADGFILDGNPSMEAFKHRFQDDVAGWTVTFDVLVHKNYKAAC